MFELPQGAEGEDGGAEWYIEGVLEELDYPNEFYYNDSTGELLLFYNGTTPSPPNSVEVPVQNEIIVLQGLRRDRF